MKSSSPSPVSTARSFELQVQIEADLEREIAAVVEAAEDKLDGLEQGQRTPARDGALAESDIPHSVSKG